MTKTEQILDQCPAAPSVLEEENRGIKDPVRPTAIRKHTIDPDQIEDRLKLPSLHNGKETAAVVGDQVERDKSGRDLANEIFPEESPIKKEKKSVRKIASSSEDEVGKKEALVKKSKETQKKKDKGYLLGEFILE